MPGAYTHLTLVRLLTAGNALNALMLPREAKAALEDYTEFCHLGAISPDYPYLVLMGDKKPAEHWANSMHHKYGTLTKGNILHIGIDYLKELAGDEQAKCLAWLLGYASHVTADVTCHPVTNLLVGDYEAGNQTDHRVSEMHQDVYIFQTRVKGDVSKSEHIKNVIGSCGSTENKTRKMDLQIEKIWRHVLSQAFPDIFKKFKLDIHSWHYAVQVWIDNLAEELTFIPSRHIRTFFTEEGLSYPRFDEIDKKKYIDALETPAGRRTSYDEVFDLAKTNVVSVWKMIAEGVFQNNLVYKEKLKVWNLDTGQEVSTSRVLWEGML